MSELNIKKRYYILDILRAIAIINMVIYHFLFDLYAFDMFSYFDSLLMNIYQQFICITFIFLSGFCFHLGRKQWKRGLIILGCAAILSVVTFFMEFVVFGVFIAFGILCFMASAIFITIPIHMLLKKAKYAHWVGFFVSLIAFIVLRYVYNFGTMEMTIANGNYLTAYFGFPPDGFIAGDYFPILPWIFLYLTGYFAFSILKQFNLLRYLSAFRCKPLEFIGRHSLIIYMAHQVILFPIVFLVSFIF